jgi:hypothetical protein
MMTFLAKEDYGDVFIGADSANHARGGFSAFAAHAFFVLWLAYA